MSNMIDHLMEDHQLPTWIFYVMSALSGWGLGNIIGGCYNVYIY